MSLGHPRIAVGHSFVCAVAHPLEDAFLVADDGSACAVADGISRDHYPPGVRSGAAVAAELFCRTVIDQLAVEQPGRPTTRLTAAFVAANAEIGRLNARTFGAVPTDFLLRDPFGCVGAAARLHGQHLHYASIGDCRVAVYSRDFVRVFETPDALSVVRGHLDRLSFSTPAARKTYARSRLRNRPAATDEAGTPIGYGALTGEAAAMAFVRGGSLVVPTGGSVLVYSDGFAELLSRDDFAAAVRETVLATPADLPARLDDWYRAAPPADDATVVLLAHPSLPGAP